MKWISAFIRPHRLDDLRTSLAAVGVNGITVTEALAMAQPEHPAADPRVVFDRPQHPCMLIELAVTDELSEAVVEAIMNISRTGKRGDGKIIVRPLAGALRIRTQEHSNSAL
jgi:nitrogen regulatory protein P-II 1